MLYNFSSGGFAELKGFQKKKTEQRVKKTNTIRLKIKKLENIIMKLYYQEMVTFQLRETKELWCSYTNQRWNPLMRLKVD